MASRNTRSGLLGTPLGEKMWTANVKQIVEATVRSVQLAIVHLASRQETYFSALANTRLRMSTDDTKARMLMASQTQLFGCVQKKYGLEHALGGMLSIFKDKGVRPNMAIVPADTAALLRCRSENRDFMINGALAQMYQINPQRSLNCYVHSTNIAMFEHRGYFADQQETRHNVLVRDREIGQYFCMKYDPSQQIIPGIPGQRDIMIVDHNKQQWARLSFLEALKMSGLFDDTGNLTSYGIDFFHFKTTFNDYLTNIPGAARARLSKRAAPTAVRPPVTKRFVVGSRQAYVGATFTYSSDTDISSRIDIPTRWPEIFDINVTDYPWGGIKPDYDTAFFKKFINTLYTGITSTTDKFTTDEIKKAYNDMSNTSQADRKARKKVLDILNKLGIDPTATSTGNPTGPRVLKIVSGDNQSAENGTQLSDEIVVRLENADGSAVTGENVDVQFSDGGTASGTTGSGPLPTDTNGEIRMNWLLGFKLGGQTITFTYAGVASLIVRANSTNPGIPRGTFKEVKHTTTTQNTKPGDSVDVEVKVTDTSGTPMSGEIVTFKPKPGSLASPISATTDVNGLAKTTWTVGPTTGTQSLEYESNGTSNNYTVNVQAAGAPPSVTNYYDAPITLVLIEEMLMNGKNVPISLYVLRPNIRFRMGGMVVAVGGEETGFTVIGNSNFQLSDEATTKTALGHYTTYFRPIIHTERNVMVCPDAVFQGYVAGGGSKMCELKDYQIDKRASEPARLNDLIVMPAALDDPMDGVVPLMGNFDKLSDTFQALSEMSSGVSAETKRTFKLFADKFEGVASLVNAKFYGTRNDANSMEGMDSMDMVGYNERYSGHNVLCFQGRQRGYKVTGVSGASMLGDFCNEVEGRGHLAGIEFTDSSIREFTGDISFRDDPNVRLAAAY